MSKYPFRPIDTLIAWVCLTGMAFLSGWITVAFVSWELAWPLATRGSRIWLVLCGLGTAGALIKEDRK